MNWKQGLWCFFLVEVFLAVVALSLSGSWLDAYIRLNFTTLSALVLVGLWFVAGPIVFQKLRSKGRAVKSGDGLL